MTVYRPGLLSLPHGYDALQRYAPDPPFDIGRKRPNIFTATTTITRGRPLLSVPPHYGDHATLGRTADDMAKWPTKWERQ